jgi:hypothetical protein
MPKKERDTMSKKTKRYLMLLVAVGLIAVAAGGSGTFAGFNAEVANNGNFFTTGTLFLHNTAGGFTCSSESAASNQNTGPGNGCHTIFATELGSSTGVVYYPVTLTNAGTLDAGSISFYTTTAGGSSCATTADQTLTAGTSNGGALTGVTTINVHALAYGLPSGTFITIDSHQYATSGAVNAGATQIVLSSGVVGTIANNDPITFQPFANGVDLCSGLDVSIIEASSANTGNVGDKLTCAWPTPSTTPCDPTAAKTLNDLPHNFGQSFNFTLAAGTGNTHAIDATKSRYFWIAVKPDAAFDNTYQNKKATVDILWHIDQA